MAKQEAKEYNIDTMTGVGKKVTIAGREYEILPVNIEDMHYIIGEQEEERLIIFNRKQVEENNDWITFGVNITNEKKKEIFLKMLNKYVFYKKNPMTEELLIEHNWSFKEIGKFLYVWIEEISE